MSPGGLNRKLSGASQFAFAIVTGIALAILAGPSLGQDAIPPLISTEIPLLAVPPGPQETAPESPHGGYELPSADPAPANPLADEISAMKTLSAGLAKRLADVEKQLKSSTDAETRKANTYPTYKVTGFLQLDTALYYQQPLNIATVGNAQDGAGFRRARLAVQGKAAEQMNYQLEVDFAAAGRPSFFDNYLEQENIPFLGDVRIGQYLQPFSVDAMSGFRNLPFLERSLPFLAFVPFRRVGIMASNGTEDDRTHWAYSVFRTGAFNNAPLGDDRSAIDIGDVGGYSFSTRVTHLLYYDEFAEDRYLWHVGASYNYSRLSANTAAGSTSPVPFYQSKTTPEFGPLGYLETNSNFGNASFATPVFVDTGKYQARSFNLVGLETVCQSGPLAFQGEYMATVVDSVVGQIFYHGAYGEVIYHLTGEHRGYDKKLAALKNPVPYTDFIPLRGEGIRGWGAWEISARWSFVDLRNPAKLDGHYLSGTTSAGNGILNDSTLGVSWHLNAHSKIQFNWIHAMLNNSAKGYSTADLFVSRFQVDF